MKRKTNRQANSIEQSGGVQVSGIRCVLCDSVLILADGKYAKLAINGLRPAIKQGKGNVAICKAAIYAVKVSRFEMLLIECYICRLDAAGLMWL